MASPDQHKKSKKYIQDPVGSAKVHVAKQLEPSHGYDEYLLLLQQRKKVLENFRDKNEKQRELERREQGFCLYVNGANVNGKIRADKASPRRAPSRKLDSAREAREVESALSKSRIKSIDPDRTGRSRTAPENNNRKVWNATSMEIKTGNGQKMHVHAPDNVTGNYDDDFEEYVSESYDEGAALHVEEEPASGVMLHGISPDNTDPEESDEIVDEHLIEDGLESVAEKPREARTTDQRLMLSIAEVQALRRSLVMNPKIGHRVLTKDRDSHRQGNSAESTVVSSNSSMESGIPKVQQLQPTDVIVLEFAPRQTEAKNLGISKKAHTSSSVVPNAFVSPLLPTARQSIVKAKHLSAGPRMKKTGASLISPRKLSTAEAIQSSAERSALMAAMQVENEQVLLHQQHHRRSDDASSADVNEIDPSSVRGVEQQNALDNGVRTLMDPACTTKVRLALEKVLLMSPEQQQKLIIGLEHLEQAATSNHYSTNFQYNHNAALADDCATKAVENQRASHQSKYVITMEWLSNWGHTSRIGMTEVQVFDCFNKQATICLQHGEDSPRATNVHSPFGKVECLFNQKFKTIKEKNMFSTTIDKDTPVIVTFFARASAPLSYFKLWNYNRSMEDLSIGVRRIRLAIDGSVVFDGELDKGCGNQVFDYSTVVSLQCTDLPKSVTVTSSRAATSISEPSLQPLPIPIGSPPSEVGMKGSAFMQSTTDNTGVLPPGKETESCRQQIKAPHKSQVSVVSKRMTAHLAHIAGASKQGHRSQNVHPNAKSSNLADKPLWLPQPARNVQDSLSALPVEQMAFSNERPVWLRKDSSHSEGDTPEGDVSTKDITSSGKHDELSDLPSWPQRGIPHLHTVLDEPSVAHQKAAASHRPLVVADEHEEVKWRKGASVKMASSEISRVAERRRGSAISTGATTAVCDITKLLDAADESGGSDTNEELSPLKRIERLRARWRNNRDLEKSWSSLSAFSHNQRGRISMDLEGDILDEYVRAMRSCALSSDKEGSHLSEEHLSSDVKVVSEPAPVAKDGTLSDRENEALSHHDTASPLTCVGAYGGSNSEGVNTDDDDFVIPELPFGKELTVNIKSTWGDRYYVGLNGIEIFTSTGEPPAITKISADPADVNVLPGYGNDPRVVQNLIDGVNRTRDDIHMWLAPFTPNGNHYIHITFEKPCHIALLRLWNYNKSRIHSYRGARDVEISLDGNYIFKGEIARACGSSQGGTEAFGDTILFTTSEEILEAISRYDEYYEGAQHDDSEECDNEDERPATADNSAEERPYTSVDVRKCVVIASDDEMDHDSKSINIAAAGDGRQAETLEETLSAAVGLTGGSQIPPSAPLCMSNSGDFAVYRGKKLTFNFVETWGDQFYLGLTGLELISPNGSPLPVSILEMQASPRDLRVLSGYEQDSRTLDKLIDGVNITTSDEHMWLIPFTHGNDHRVTFNFEESIAIVGVRFWNYNKSPEDTYRGAKVVHVELDGYALSPPTGLLIRKAPGNCFFDFAQELMFFEVFKRYSGLSTTLGLSISDLKKQDSDTNESYLSPIMPTGFIYQFHFLSTWGDHYYVGLNGIEFYDEIGKKILLDDNNIAAYPQSVNVLDNVVGDVRTPDKLIDGVNDSRDPQHMWLAPILPHLTNRIFVIFDQPQTVSMIKIWNYSKTAQRGVKEFALLVDDLLVWNGQLKPVTQSSKGILPTVDVTQPYHTILFSSDSTLISKEKHTIISNLHEEQDIRMTNDCKVITASGQEKSFAQKVVADQALRPKTSVTNKKSHMRR